MIKDLIKAASDLDDHGFHVEAELMDKIIERVAFGKEEESEDDSDLETDWEIEFESDLPGSEEDSEEEEEEEEDTDEEVSVEECLEYCASFSDAQKVELIKALLDSMGH